MGCTKLGHIHQWPTTGTLVVQRCETRCNFCEGEAARKDWKYAWFLRRHVRAIHVRKGKYSHLKVDMGWDARNLRGTCKKGIKKEESSDSDIAEPKQFVAQPLYEEQKDQGMFYHQACVNPGDLQLEGGAEFDFNDYHPFPGLGNEEPAFPKDMSYNVNDFETFLDDATGGHGTIPTGTRYCEVELDADGVPIVDDFDPEGFVAQQDNFPTELPWANENHTKYNSFFFSDYSNVSSTNVSSEDIPLSKQPVAEILEHGVHVEEDLRQRVLGNLTMAGDQMTDQGLDVKQLISCIGEYTRLLVRGIETDVKPTIDSEGYALKPNPATLPMPY